LACGSLLHEDKMERILKLLARCSPRVTFVLIALVFIVAGALAWMGGDRLRYPDEVDYSSLAQSTLDGRGYVNDEGKPTAYHPPGWPFLLTAVYRVSARPLAGKLLNAIALACTAWLLSSLVGRSTAEGKPFAPLLLLLCPLVLYTATTLYPQTIGTTLLIAVLVLLNVDMRSALRCSLAGFLLGFLILSIPAFLLVTPLLLAGHYFPNRKMLSLYVKRSLLVLLCAAAIVAPWTVRNARVFHALVPVSTNSGVNLLLGNSENTGPNKGVNVDISRYVEQTKGMSEVEIDRHFRRSAVAWVIGNPSAAASLYARKVLNYFNFRNELYVVAEQSRLKDAVQFFSYYPMLCAAILRVLVCRQVPLSPAELILYVVYFGNAFASAIFFTRIRFRSPFDVVLLAIVAIFIGKLISRMNAKVAAQSPACDATMASLEK
jgi:hypothetical protein